ncbi:hypothetical protein GGF32_008080 [Allomyces javanicus]|nr:hypothetical protein GGF32_008080 [Allomyces javanicus]
MPGNPDLLREYVATQRALVAHGRPGAPSWPGSTPPSAAPPAAHPAPAPAPPPPARTAGTRRVAVRRIVSLELAADHYGVDDIDVHSSVSQARTRKRIDAPRPFPPAPPLPPDGEDGDGMRAVRAAVKDQRRERRRAAQVKPERQVATAKKAVAKRDGKKRGTYGDVKVLETFLEQAKLAPSHRLTVPKGIFDKARSAPAVPAAHAVPTDLAAIATHEPGIGRHLPKARDRDRDREAAATAAAASRSRSRSRDRIKDKGSKSKRKNASKPKPKPTPEETNDDEEEEEEEDTRRTGGAASREKDRGRRFHEPRPARRNPDQAPPRRVESPVLLYVGVREDEAMDVIETGSHGAQEPSPTSRSAPPPRRSRRMSSTRSVPATTTKGGGREPAHGVDQGTSTAGHRITRRDVAPARSAVPASPLATVMVDAAVQMSPQSTDLDLHHQLDDDHGQDHHAADHLIIAHPPPPSPHAEWPAWMDDAEIVDPDAAWPHSVAERAEMSPTAGLIRELEDATRTFAGSEAQFMEMVEDDGAGMEEQPAGPTWGAAWEETVAQDKPSEVDWREPLYLSGLVPRPPPLPSSMTYLHVAPGVLSEYESSWDVAMGDEVDREYELSHPATQSSWAVSYETRRPTTAAWANFPAGPGSPVTDYAGNSRTPPLSQPLSAQTDAWGASDVPRIEAGTGGRRALPPSRSDPAAALAFRYRKHRLY